MPEIDKEMIVNIINLIEEKGDPYYPVSYVAHELGCAENDPSEIAALSSGFVAHMLHLQDLGCIENIRLECGWGYLPTGGGVVRIQAQALHGHPRWETPHRYKGDSGESAIRITANARQLRDALTDTTLSDRIKMMCLNDGGALVRKVLEKVALGAIA